jgi:hypothetical protein
MRHGIGSLVFGCGWVQKHGGNRSQFPLNSLSKSRVLVYWHCHIPLSNKSSTTITNRFCIARVLTSQGLDIPKSCGWARVENKRHYPSGADRLGAAYELLL